MSFTLQGGFANIKDILRIVRSLYAIESVNPEIFEGLVEYMVQKGYDHDDFVDMGLSKSVTLINNIIMSNPKISNVNFMIHVITFVKRNINDFNRIQLARLVDTFKLHEKLKTEEEMLNALEERLLVKRDEKQNKLKKR